MSERAILRGVDQRQEVDPRQLIRDTRPFLSRVVEWARQPEIGAGVLLFLACLLVIEPLFADMALLAGGIYFLWVRAKRVSLPMRKPMSSGEQDWEDGKPKNPTGILYIGNERFTNEECWVDDDDLRRHMLILGTTGSGKTEAIKAKLINALCWGAGFVVIDGKADVSLYTSIYSMCRRFGRDDDIRAINFMTSEGGRKAPDSNTINPFTGMAASELAELLSSALDDAGNTSGGDMWKGRCIALLKTAVRIGCELRDQKLLLFSARILRDLTDLNTLIDIYFGRPIELGTPGTPDFVRLERYELSDEAKSSLYGYLKDLAGFSWQKAQRRQEQDSKPREQHGFLTMQLTRLFEELIGTYDYIFGEPLGDVDMVDVVLFRRVLVVLLPSIQKSEDTMGLLGKIMMASLKSMMSKTLGNRLMGSREEILDSRPTTFDTPFATVFDECGYYLAVGAAVMAAQARSLGFSLWFAAQDVSAMKKKGGMIEREVGAIIANCGTLLIMKVVDPGETLELIQKSSGEVLVNKTTGYEARDGLFGRSYLEGQNISTQVLHRIHPLDLRAQRPGETHILFGDQLVRARVYYANPELASYFRVNRFLQVRAAEPDEEAEVLLEEVRQRLCNPQFRLDQVEKPAPDDAYRLARFLQRLIAINMRPVERACAAVCMWRLSGQVRKSEKKELGRGQPRISPPDVERDRRMDIFAGIKAEEEQAAVVAREMARETVWEQTVNEMVSRSDDPAIPDSSLFHDLVEEGMRLGESAGSALADMFGDAAEPAASPEVIHNHARLAEKAAGAGEREAAAVADAVVGAVEQAREYHPQMKPPAGAEGRKAAVTAIQELLDSIDE